MAAFNRNDFNQFYSIFMRATHSAIVRVGRITTFLSFVTLLAFRFRLGHVSSRNFRPK